MSVFYRQDTSLHVGEITSSSSREGTVQSGSLTVCMLQADLTTVFIFFIISLTFQGGKNFHIFHYLLYGMDADQLQEYSLTSDYRHR